MFNVSVLAPCLIVLALGGSVRAEIGTILFATGAFIFFALPVSVPLAIGTGLLASLAGFRRFPLVVWGGVGASVGLLVGIAVGSFMRWEGQSLVWIYCGVGIVVALIERWNWSE